MNGELAEVYHSEKSGELPFEQSNYRSLLCTFEASKRSNEVIEKNRTRIVIIASIDATAAQAQKSTALPI